MIVHTLGADTRISYAWTSNGQQLTPTEADFVAVDETGAEVLRWALGDPSMTTGGTYSIDLYFEDDLAVAPGFYEYTLRVNDGTDWHLISGGLLRVR
jgi:hypothetical protein